LPVWVSERLIGFAINGLHYLADQHRPCRIDTPVGIAAAIRIDFTA
jgi:hypothetical protein